MEDTVSQVEDLNFYSELNMKPLHDFDQSSDLVCPDMKWINLGSHVGNKFVG